MKSLLISLSLLLLQLLASQYFLLRSLSTLSLSFSQTVGYQNSYYFGPALSSQYILISSYSISAWICALFIYKYLKLQFASGKRLDVPVITKRSVLYGHLLQCLATVQHCFGIQCKRAQCFYCYPNVFPLPLR